MCGAPAETVEVAIVEDLEEVRNGIALLIDRSDGFRCRQKFASMEEAFCGLNRRRPHIALVDIGLPGMSGIDGLRLLKQKYPEVHVVILTVYKDSDRIFEAMCAGACGYLLETTAPTRLVENLREVMSGGAPMSPEVSRRVVELCDWDDNVAAWAAICFHFLVATMWFQLASGNRNGITDSKPPWRAGRRTQRRRSSPREQ